MIKGAEKFPSTYNRRSACGEISYALRFYLTATKHIGYFGK